MVSPYKEAPFELMCDASDFVVGVVLGQQREKRFHPIYFASKTLNDAQRNYTTTKKELLAIDFTFISGSIYYCPILWFSLTIMLLWTF